jgi:DNA replication protein DnaC
MPLGLSEAMERWLPGNSGENLWIYGPATSGKTGLAIALMRARCEIKNCSGAYASVLAVGDSLRSYYNRTVGAGTWSERIGMVKDPSELYGALMPPECLVLDMIDCMPQDKRIAENFVNVLAERYNANKVTIFTAFDTSISLQSSGRHPFGACEIPGTLAMNRLAKCDTIKMVPALQTILVELETR